MSSGANISGKGGVLAAALAAALLTLALIACFYAGWRAAGLPFIPFDIFDWLARVLAGWIIETGIDSMVAVIRTFHLGPIAETAKKMEQAMGIIDVLIAGTICGVLLFVIVRALKGRRAGLAGLVLGAAASIPVILISSYVGQTAKTSPVTGALWIFAAFLLWGAVLGLSCRRLLPTLRLTAKPVEEIPMTKDQGIVETIDRRRFLARLAGTTAVITVAGAVVGKLSALSYFSSPVTGTKWSQTHLLPNANAPVKPAPGTRPEFTPLEKHYRIDIDTFPPSIDAAQWRLKTGGLVGQPLSLTIGEIRGMTPMHQFITLSCISNPVGGDLAGTTRWTGTSLKDMLPLLKLKPEATHLKITSADGFWEVVSLDQVRADRRIMLTYAWDGVPLLPKHGYPLRIYIPDLYGMKQPKWIVSVEAMDHWEPGYWVVRGWDEVARMKATSVIDTVAVHARYKNAAGQNLIPVGGIAHAGARGISKVELKIDDGPWRQTELRTPLSHMTWVIWRYDWAFEPGEHTFIVRCYDGNGAPQIETPAPPEPSGATGYFSKTKRV